MSKEVRDPLTEGNTLAVTKDGNYKILESSADVRKADKEAVKAVANAKVASTAKAKKNESTEELAEVVKTTKRKGR